MVIAIDPGHGGRDPGAVYNGRQEKDDVLRLAKAVGDLLRAKGIEVVYTREGDIYESPTQKAQDGNRAGADYFVSFHRNSSEYPNQYSGAEVLVYSDTGVRSTLANNILEGMERAGFKNLGVDERKDLTVLRRTQMPAVLIEAGFLNNDTDNNTFDTQFDELARGIADGILETLGYSTYGMTGSTGATAYVPGEQEAPPYPVGNDFSSRQSYMPVDDDSFRMPPEDVDDYGTRGSEMYYDDSAEIIEQRTDRRACNCQCPDVLYRVQVGAYRNRDSADRMLNSLLVEEFPAFIVFDDGLYKVQVGAYRNLSNAIAMENKLRQYRYNTYITTK